MKISEIFYSLQGEGRHRSQPAIFIRFPHCNLMCKGENWVCDTLEFRNKYKEMTPAELYMAIKDIDSQIWDLIDDGLIRIIFTGGEPLLKENYESIKNFIEYIEDEKGICPKLELETNGSLNLTSEMKFTLSIFDQINCSPKLKSSGASEDRYNLKTLNYFNTLENTDFKFVISSEDDFKELEKKFNFIDINHIWLMPATFNSSEKEKKDWSQKVWKYAIDHHLNFTLRDHIIVWGMRSGV